MGNSSLRGGTMLFSCSAECRLCTKRQSASLCRENLGCTESAGPASPERHKILKEIKMAGKCYTDENDEAPDIDGGRLIANPDLSSRCSSCFHGFRKPSIGIEDYLMRLRDYFMCSDSCFLLALVYISRFLDFCPDFVVNAFSIHRLLATSLVVSVKFHEDVIYSNTFYAKVCGLRQEELNRGELEFLKMIKWDCGVSQDVNSLYHEVLHLAEKSAVSRASANLFASQ
ncbi:unnamed protein product [Durusdinium trenchii]|uniref:Uncharacterized protein n=2 Tax=Durusdinium trenchii TaxID=1381693 RepID=A0ABP0MA27_9DINO